MAAELKQAPIPSVFVDEIVNHKTFQKFVECDRRGRDENVVHFATVLEDGQKVYVTGETRPTARNERLPRLRQALVAARTRIRTLEQTVSTLDARLQAVEELL